MTTKGNKTSDVKSEVETLLKEILPVAAKFSMNFATAKELIGKHKPQILKLREKFGVSKGTSGKKLDVEGNSIYWSEFVDEYFGCSQHWLNVQLGVKKEASSSPSEKKPDSEKPLYKKGFSDGRESVANVEEVKASIKDGVNKKYERQVFELEKKLEKTIPHQKMLVKLLDEIEKVGDRVPLTLIETAKKMRSELKAKDVVVETKKALAAADLTEVKSVVAKLDNDASKHMVAKIEGSDEFGVFSKKDCAPFTKEKAVFIGTQERAMENLRERAEDKKPVQVEAARAGK